MCIRILIFYQNKMVWKKDTSYLSRVPHRNLVLIVRMFLELISRFWEMSAKIRKYRKFLISRLGWIWVSKPVFCHPHPFLPRLFLFICTQYKNKMGFVIRKSTKNDSKEILKLIQVITKFFNTKSQFDHSLIMIWKWYS